MKSKQNVKCKDTCTSINLDKRKCNNYSIIVLLTQPDEVEIKESSILTTIGFRLSEKRKKRKGRSNLRFPQIFTLVSLFHFIYLFLEVYNRQSHYKKENCIRRTGSPTQKLKLKKRKNRVLSKKEETPSDETYTYPLNANTTFQPITLAHYTLVSNQMHTKIVQTKHITINPSSQTKEKSSMKLNFCKSRFNHHCN